MNEYQYNTIKAILKDISYCMYALVFLAGYMASK